MVELVGIEVASLMIETSPSRVFELKPEYVLMDETLTRVPPEDLFYQIVNPCS